MSSVSVVVSESFHVQSKTLKIFLHKVYLSVTKSYIFTKQTYVSIQKSNNLFIEIPNKIFCWKNTQFFLCVCSFD